MTVIAAGGVFGMCGLVNATVRRDFVFLPTKSVTTDAPRGLPLTLLEVANQELIAPGIHPVMDRLIVSAR